MKPVRSKNNALNSVLYQFSFQIRARGLVEQRFSILAQAKSEAIGSGFPDDRVLEVALQSLNFYDPRARTANKNDSTRAETICLL